MADRSEPRDSSRRISWGPRLLAPLVLILALIAVVVVVTGSVSIDDDSSAGVPGPVSGKSGAHDGQGDGAETPKTYVVEPGDLFSTIAEEFGVSVERLERLNPDVDPQTLNTGTELKIR